MRKNLHILGILFLMVIGIMKPISAFAQITTWNQLYDAMQSGGEIQLTQDITYSGSKGALVVPSGKTVTLDLNGFNINRNLSAATNYGSVIQVSGTLIINDSKDSGEIKGGYVKRIKNTYDGGGGLFIYGGGNVTLNGGSICENKVDGKGAGVIIEPGGFLTINGGSISNNINTDNNNGGAVYIHSSTSSGGLGGTMTMNGGELSGNKAGCGAGVYIDGEASGASVFTMNGGVIKDNIANGYYGGGGITVCDNSTFNMTGGVITHNVTLECVDESGEGGYGGGILMMGGSTCHVNITITEDTILGIYENTAYFGGDDISKGSGDVMNLIAANRMVRENGAIFSENAKWVTDEEGHRARSGRGNIYTRTGEITDALELSCSVPCLWCDLQDKIYDASNGDIIRLSSDVIATNSEHLHYYDDIDSDTHLIIPAGKQITIDLNGFTIDRNLKKDTAMDNGDVFTVNGSLTIVDSSTELSGAITGGNNTSDGGAVFNNGYFELEGGTIGENSCAGTGGGVFNTGEILIEGGSILNNSAYEGSGIYQSGTMLLCGSPIFGESQTVYLPVVETPTEQNRSTYVITKAGGIGDTVIPVKVANEVSGRDILVSGASGGQDAAVVSADLNKLSVQQISTDLNVIFNAAGRDGGIEPKAVIEFAIISSKIIIRRLGLNDDENAIYTVYYSEDGITYNSAPEYIISMSNNNKVTIQEEQFTGRQIVDVKQGCYKVIEQSWTWAYNPDSQPAVDPSSAKISADVNSASAIVNNGDCVIFTFDGVAKTEELPKHDEAVKVNSMLK